MSEAGSKRVFVGYLPTGTTAFVAEGAEDPITILLRDAEQKLAAERAIREAEAEKAKPLQSARTGGKLRRLLGLGRDMGRLQARWSEAQRAWAAEVPDE